MMKNLIKTAIFLFSAAFFALSSLNFAYAGAAAGEQGNYGLDETVKVGNNESAFLSPKGNTPSQLAGRIIGVVLSFVGVIFFVLIVISGVRWMTSQGNDSVIDSAKQTIISATLGLIVTLSAYAITSFIGQQLTNTK